MEAAPSRDAKPSVAKTRKLAPLTEPAPAASPADLAAAPLPADLELVLDPAQLAADQHGRATRELEQLQLRLDILTRGEEVLATWAAMPFFAWGGLTLAGCIYRFQFVSALIVAVVVIGGCLLPFVRRHRFLTYAAPLSAVFNLCGWSLLGNVGGILIPATRRVMAYLSLIQRDEETGAVIAPDNLNQPGVSSVIAAVLVGLCVVLGLISLYQMAVVAVHAWKKKQLEQAIVAQAQKVHASFPSAQPGVL